MTTTMDIAVCFDCSSSIAFYSKPICRTILSIIRHALLYGDGDDDDILMALIEFQSHTDNWVTSMHPFTSSFDTFKQWINDVQTNGGNFNECKATADALNVALKLDWRPNNNNERYHEKLVILFTDGPPCNFSHDKCPYNSNDLWKMANAFAKQDIKLVVIGIEPSIIVYDDFYYALASKTGGEYIPLINASRVLSFVIKQAILGEQTLSQLLHHHLNIHEDIELNSLYHRSIAEERARFMFKYCRTIADIRKWMYTYRDQPSGYDIYLHDNYSESHSPSLMIRDHEYFYGNGNIFASTPISDDEGYRTRLPTTASANSSYMSIGGDTDDEVI